MTLTREDGNIILIVGVIIYVAVQLTLFSTLTPSLAAHTMHIFPRLAKDGCFRVACYAGATLFSVVWPVGIVLQGFLRSAAEPGETCCGFDWSTFGGGRIADEEQAVPTSRIIDAPPSYYEVVRLPSYPEAVSQPAHPDAVRLPTYREVVRTSTV
ncbi:hypothetical protein VTK26DRAFT_2204 [Humicola hyalothermophila]